MKKVLEVCGTSVKSGEKASTVLNVLEKSAGNLTIPVQLVNGTSDGPILLVSAGVHGCEYAGIEAAIRLYRETDPATLHGALICVPVLNTSAFENKTPYVCPIDGLNINRLFPGDIDGSASQKIAAIYFKEVATKADYIIDMHGGDLPEDLAPYTILSHTGNKEADRRAEEMACIYGVSMIDKVNRPGSLTHESTARGIPGIIGESGGLGRLQEEDVAVHLNGARNIMAHLGITDTSWQASPSQRTFSADKIRLGVHKGGILRLHVRPGDEVEQDQILAEILNFQGDTIDRLKSPVRAIVRIVIPKYAVNSGDKVIYLSQLD